MNAGNKRRVLSASLLCAGAMIAVAAVKGNEHQSSIPNGTHFPNPAGTSRIYSTSGVFAMDGPFFQSLGSNGRSCGTCHQPGDGMSVSASHLQKRFDDTDGLDPVFRP